jgi:hypothetical protein
MTKHCRAKEEDKTSQRVRDRTELIAFPSGILKIVGLFKTIFFKWKLKLHFAGTIHSKRLGLMFFE